jgi:hypothetical protein
MQVPQIAPVRSSGSCRMTDSVAAYHAARRWRARCMRVLLRRWVRRGVLHFVRGLLHTSADWRKGSSEA